mmetsp:Transcript_34798/g.55961  ORF Transcript_34798/g.55961 Transcript_34798/m.55961 type:complete len:458 (-) Transcript_34798:204-1577(-)
MSRKVLSDEDLKTLFQNFDRNGDGEISKSEFRQGLSLLGLRVEDGDKTWKYVLKNDQDGNGKIKFEEFKNFAVYRNGELQKIFDSMDKDGSGKISEENLLEALKEYGLSATKSKVRKIIKHFDKNGDGEVCFEEFQRITMLFPSMKVARILDTATDDFVFGYYGIPKSESSHKSQTSPLNVFLSGGVAGFVSRTLTAPADRIKMMMQSGGKGTRIGQVIKEVYAEGGLAAFWRGNGANVIKIMPESAAKFYCYEYLKQQIIADPADVKIHERLLSGSLAGMMAQTVIYPMEVVKTRMAISAPGTYSGIIGCFSKIMQNEGLGALYKGLGASNIGIIPYAGVDLAVYGTVKDRWIAQNPNKKPAWYETLTMGAFSSFCGQIVAYPLQLVRTKLQSSGLPGKPVFNGMGDCVAHVMKEEGAMGFYRGIGPNFAKGIPAVAIGYVAYEKAKDFFTNVLKL